MDRDRTDDEVMASALSTYYRTARQSGVTTGKPTAAIIRTKDKRRYVVLRDHAISECVVYRIRNDGALKRIKQRIPDEVLIKAGVKKGWT
jgi:6-phosphogluconolactonase (cycloisomerase 2 family)